MNVMFKRGTQANLNALVAQVKAGNGTFASGSFYLTSDTDRLYIAQGSEELVELNKSITVVTAVSDLPTSNVEVGQFYYIKGPDNAGNATNTHGGNILAVCTAVDSNGANPQWTQVNPDTDNNDRLSNVVITKGTTSGGIIPYTLDFYIQNKSGADLTSFSRTLNVAASDIISLVDTDVGVTVANNRATITTKAKNLVNNSLSTGSSFVIEGDSDSVAITAVTGGIRISTGISSGSVRQSIDSSTTGEVSASVQVNGADSGDVLTLTGENDIAVRYNDSKVKIGHSNTASAEVTSTATTLGNGGNFTAIIASNYDSYGHVTDQTKQNITLPTISVSRIEVDSTDKSKLVVALKDQTGSEGTTEAISNSILYNTITIDGTTSTINNQASIGSFYSAAHIDEMMRELDALTYKGTVASNASVPTSNVRIGDTYKVSATDSGITVGGQSADLGDLLIATGTEDPQTGYITSGTLTWTLVHSGSESDTTYYTVVGAGGTNEATLGIHASTGSETTVDISGDSVITITPTATDRTNNVDGGIVISHGNSGATSGSYGQNSSGAHTAGTSVVIPAISVDSKGHITSISDTSISLPGDNTLAGDISTKTVSLNNGTGVSLGEITFANGNMITPSLAVDAQNSNEITVTLNHNAVSTANDTTSTATIDLTASTSASRQLTVVDSITRDSYGHITTLDTKTVTLERSDDALVQSATAGTNSIAIDTILQDYQGADKGNSAFSIASAANTIEVTSTIDSNNNAVAINLDLVWGSF